MTSIGFRYESASAKLMYITESMYSVSNVYSQRRQQGHASGLMQKIVDYADKNQFTLKLLAQRYGYSDRVALDDHQLVEFYEKFGFQAIGTTRPIFMVRHPSQEKRGL